MIDFAVEMDIVEKRGSFYSYGDTRLGQGRENAKTFLQENPDISVVLAERDSRSYRDSFAAALRLALLLVGAYTVQKLAAGQLIAPVEASIAAPGNVWIALLVVALAGTHIFLRLNPEHPLARRASVWLYAGLYLDEWVTRTTLKVWPARLPVRLQPKTLSPFTEETVR